MTISRRSTEYRRGRIFVAPALVCGDAESSLTSVVPRPGSSVYLLGYAKPLAWHVDSATGLAISDRQQGKHRGFRKTWFSPATRQLLVF